MVFTADDLLKWSDFPKGLRVLLVDEDCNSGALIRSKLEEMDYIVSVFCNENDALSAMSSKPESFHIAIVEVSTSNNNGAFKFLEVAKDLPTIMTSNKQCLATMMKCIALGAVEFLLKPLSDEKLKNIWQHVVHKAFNAGQKDLPDSLKPVKSVVPMLHIKLEEVNQPKCTTMSSRTVSMASAHDDNNQEDLLSVGSYKYPAPSTPQLNHVVRLADDGDCPHQTNCSTHEKVSGGDQDAEAKSVDTISSGLAAETNVVQESPPQILGDVTVVKEEDEVADCSTRSESNMSSSPPENNKDDDPCQSGGEVAKIPSKGCANHTSSGNKPNRKKMKVDWTPELHKKFVQAVEQLGVDQAIPSRILESMKVEGLTRHNVASHLQKYRMQRRHILPKEDERRWPQPRDASQRSSYNYGHKPVMAYPPSYNHLHHHSNLVQLPPAQFFPAWGTPGGYSGGGVQSWGPAFYPPWQPPSGPGMHADAWGCPVMPPQPPAPYQPYSPFFQNSNSFGSDHPRRHMNFSMPHNPDLDLLPAEEVIDKVVKEAINKPWLPLPLGLKAPSTDSVLTELSRQGISTVPPPPLH